MELNAEGFTISAEEFTHIETIDRYVISIEDNSIYVLVI